MFAREDTHIIRRLEYDLVVLFDGDLFLRLWIDTLTGGDRLTLETSEIGQGDLAVAFSQIVSNSSENSVYKFRSVIS